MCGKPFGQMVRRLSKRALTALAIATIAWLASGPRPASAVGDPADPNAGWAFRAESLLLWRDSPPAAPLFLDSNTEAVALSPSDVFPAMVAGPRFALFWSPDGWWSIEANYFRVQSWQGAAGVNADGTIEQNNVYGFRLAGMDSVEMTSASAIQSFELTGRARASDRITWLAGFRWVEWNDSLGIVDTAGAAFESFSTQTIDNLYGAQGGFDAVLLRQGTLRLEGLGKAGIYYDHAAQQSSVTASAFPSTSNAASSDRVAFMGEVGLTAVWDVTYWLTLRAGYTMFCLSNVTAAADQVQANDLFAARPGTIIGGDTVFLNGLTLGLEARF